jgi:long-chain acyl-CoA synthetase
VLPAGAYIPFDGMRGMQPEFEAFMQGHGTAPPEVAISPDDPAIMLYTSGTTGTPKGVPASHYAICFAPQNMLATGPRCSSLEPDINLLTTPLFHLAGIGWLHGAIFARAGLVILPSADMPGIIAAIAAHRVTRATILPALMPALLDGVAQGTDLSSLRLIVYGASPIHETLLARMLENFSCGFLQNYGMTENSTSATYLAPEDHCPGSPYLLSCGRPYPHVACRWRHLRRRRGWRDRAAFTHLVQGLLESAGSDRRGFARRLVRDRRYGISRRERISVSGGPQEGYDHFGR